jgi:TrmH family RNA methyltransferase
MEQPPLSNIRIVLVETTHPGNIGAVARAMKSMTLQQLYLVRPRVFPSAEATARAAGADDVLHHAEVCQSLGDALSGCGWIVGTSARPRSIAWPELDPRGCSERSLAEASRTAVALLFGREHAGLTNAELDHCHAVVRIPTNPEFSSLNVAAAVQVLAYELLQASKHNPGGGCQRTEVSPPASAEEMERLYAHLESTLQGIGYFDPANPRRLPRRLRRLLNRLQPDRSEVNILRGILTAAQRSAARGR